MHAVAQENGCMSYLDSIANLAEKFDPSFAAIKSEIGNKAFSLVQTTYYNVDIPQGWVVKKNAFEDYLQANGINLKELSDDQPLKEQLLRIRKKILGGVLPDTLNDEIQDLLKQNSETYFAIRSSSNFEDMEDASFAGIYETYLNVRGINECIDAIKKCWASVYNERVISYCNENGVDVSTISMPVIIQEMVCADVSGVAFSVDPLSGVDTNILIEAVYGLGEALVGGSVTPQRVIYDWYKDDTISFDIGMQEQKLIPVDEHPFTKLVELDSEVAKKPAFSGEQIRHLCKNIVSLQKFYGHPIDVEWVKKGDNLYIVQVRPISNIQRSGIKGAWTTADFKDGGVSSAVCSNFMYSIYKYVFETTLPKYLHKIKLLENDRGYKMTDMIYGRPYWNVEVVKHALKKIPGFIERNFDEDLGVEVGYEGKGYVTKTNLRTLLKGVQVLFHLNKSFNERILSAKKFLKYQDAILSDLDKTLNKNFADGDFADFYENFIKKTYFHSESNYFYLIYDNTNFKSLFQEAFDKLDTDVKSFELFGGLSNLAHLKSGIDLWDIRNEIRKSPEEYSYWKNTPEEELVDNWSFQRPSNILQLLNNYISKYKYLSIKELDITVPRLDEDQSLLVKNIRGILDLDDSLDPRCQNEKQRNAYLEARSRLESSLSKAKSKSILEKLERMREFLWHREELRNYSTQMYYYVRKYTLLAGDILEDKGYLQNRDDVFHLSYEDIVKALKGVATVDSLIKRVELNKAYYNSFREYVNPPDIASYYISNSIESSDTDILNGIPCSNGEVTGTARIINSVEDIHKICKGEILITKFTDPGWTTIFSSIKAVVTETGGVLSHAAVISREYGIPAVLAVKNATNIIQDGQQITVNGNTGTVVIS